MTQFDDIYTTCEVDFDVVEPPYFCDITDEDGEFIRLEWNGGALIVTVPEIRKPTERNGQDEAIHFSSATPCIPPDKLIKAILEFQTKCIANDEYAEQ